MYLGGITFSINKSFGNLQLIPEAQGLRLSYSPSSGGNQLPSAAETRLTENHASANSSSPLNLLVPLDAVGGLWATARAFLYGVESLDENIVLPGAAALSFMQKNILPVEQIGSPEDPHSSNALTPTHPSEQAESEVLIKLYRDKPKGPLGKLNGDETCWLRMVTGRSEEERRRIKLGPRDLFCIDLACNSVMTLAMQTGAHQPKERA